METVVLIFVLIRALLCGYDLPFVDPNQVDLHSIEAQAPR